MVSNRRIGYYYSLNVYIFGYILWQAAGCSTSGSQLPKMNQMQPSSHVALQDEV
jgi:hypothetical protein